MNRLVLITGGILTIMYCGVMITYKLQSESLDMFESWMSILNNALTPALSLWSLILIYGLTTILNDKDKKWQRTQELLKIRREGFDRIVEGHYNFVKGTSGFYLEMQNLKQLGKMEDTEQYIFRMIQFVSEYQDFYSSISVRYVHTFDFIELREVLKRIDVDFMSCTGLLLSFKSVLNETIKEWPEGHRQLKIAAKEESYNKQINEYFMSIDKSSNELLLYLSNQVLEAESKET